MQRSHFIRLGCSPSWHCATKQIFKIYFWMSMTFVVLAVGPNPHDDPTETQENAILHHWQANPAPPDAATIPPPSTGKREPGQVMIFRDGPFEMPMAWCPPGSFMMGSPSHEPNRRDDETRHRVTLTVGYWMGQTEVTQAQWRAVMNDNPSLAKGDDHPVVRVSWRDARAFITRLNQIIGERVYRLPTEAEWEYACRAGTTTAYHQGPNLTGELANTDSLATDQPFPEGMYNGITFSSRAFAANPWNLYHMHGNVMEYCSDWYGPYPTGPVTNPVGPEQGIYPVLRGGGWVDNVEDCRSAARARTEVEFVDEAVGFRLVRIVK